MSRYLVVGDCHGNLSFAEEMTRLAALENIETVLQVGDFGYWPQQSNFHGLLGDLALELGVKWYFLPGNHEDWDKLDQAEANSDEHFIQVAPNIYYTGRINVWTWDGITFGAAGGAYSIDKDIRTPGWDWFPQETLKDQDLWSFDTMVSMTDSKKVDVLLTHDAPTWLEFPRKLIPVEASLQHRKMMDEAWKIAKPDLWFHGHYHAYMEYKRDNTQVYGLDCDPGFAYPAGVLKNYVIFDADEWSVTTPSYGE